jgi:hypothetical protein
MLLSTIPYTHPTVTFVIASTVLAVVGLCTFDQATSNEPYWDNATSHARCEETRGKENHFLREPSNALSNLVFMCVGLYCAGCGFYDFRHFRKFTTMQAEGVNDYTPVNGGIAMQPLLSFAFGCSVFLGGVGSFYYHVSFGIAPSPFC